MSAVEGNDERAIRLAEKAHRLDRRLAISALLNSLQQALAEAEDGGEEEWRGDAGEEEESEEEEEEEEGERGRESRRRRRSVRRCRQAGRGLGEGRGGSTAATRADQWGGRRGGGGGGG